MAHIDCRTGQRHTDRCSGGLDDDKGIPPPGGLGEENRMEWIPVTDKMPEEKDSIFAKFKGTLRWRDSMFEKISDTCLITINRKNQKIVIPAHTCDGEWKADLLRIFPETEVIAWMPLPDPYQEE